MARHGRPERMLTDNGAVFTGIYRGRGWVALERELTALGIGLSHSRPYHPQTCGKVERLHQTLKNWLARQDPAATLTGLQSQLDDFTDYYNNQRPHRAVGRRTPHRPPLVRHQSTHPRPRSRTKDHHPRQRRTNPRAHPDPSRDYQPQAPKV